MNRDEDERSFAIRNFPPPPRPSRPAPRLPRRCSRTQLAVRPKHVVGGGARSTTHYSGSYCVWAVYSHRPAKELQVTS